MAAPAGAPQAPGIPSETGPHPSAGSEGSIDYRPALARFEGLAAYYSDSLAGRATASGEPYDPGAFTAAHRELPFGTVVRVCPVAGGASVTVTINDRGPFGDDERIIDLSRAAAAQLGMLRAGVIPVVVEVLEYGHE